MASHLRDLARPFPDRYVEKNPRGGGSYVSHHVVNQRLLSIVGPFDFQLVEVIRGHVPGRPPNPNGTSARAKAGTPDLDNAIVGAVCRLRLEVDGRHVQVEEVGDCEEPNNWPHDGARMKDAMSDAFKRCAMRLGLGLHLWSQDAYFLYELLSEREGADRPAPVEAAQPAQSEAEQRSRAAHPAARTEANADPTGPGVTVDVVAFRTAMATRVDKLDRSYQESLKVWWKQAGLKWSEMTAAQADTYESKIAEYEAKQAADAEPCEYCHEAPCVCAPDDPENYGPSDGEA